MKKYIIYSILLVVGVFVSACSEAEDPSSTTDGWHFPGRDCLACHNVDLNEEKHLLIGGTLYKAADVADQDDMNNVCGGELVVNFLDANGTKEYISVDYEDLDSKGYEGKGNIFILQRTLSQLSAESFTMEIRDKDGVLLAKSSNLSHNFTTADYDIANSDDNANRVSCNSCHIKAGRTSPLYVQQNALVCK